MFLEKRAKWISLKTKSREELSSLNETLSVCFALPSTRRPHLRDASLWCSSALEEAMLHPSRFIFLFFLFCFLSFFFFFFTSRFISWGMLKGVNDSFYSDNLHKKKRGGLFFVPKMRYVLFEKIKIKKQGRTPTRPKWLTAESWKAGCELSGPFLNGMLITCVLQ